MNIEVGKQYVSRAGLLYRVVEKRGSEFLVEYLLKDEWRSSSYLRSVDGRVRPQGSDHLYDLVQEAPLAAQRVVRIVHLDPSAQRDRTHIVTWPQARTPFDPFKEFEVVAVTDPQPKTYLHYLQKGGDR